MASEQSIKLQTCKICNEPDTTSVVIPIDIHHLHHEEDEEYIKADDEEINTDDEEIVFYTFIKFTENITLTQTPKETVTVSVALKWIKNYTFFDRNAGHSYDLNVKFNNYLHEISEDYIYAIQLKVLKLESLKNHEYHINLFSQEKIRSASEISIKDDPLNISYDELRANKYFCLSIKRFNTARKMTNVHCPSENIGMILLKAGKVYSDVSLKVGEKFIYAHKIILSSKSDVFKAIFLEQMQINENEAKECHEIDINDVEFRVVEEMVNYMYTGKAENFAELSEELLKVAIKYEIHDLKVECEEFFMFNLNFENAVNILELARVYEVQNLRDKVTVFVSKHEEMMVKEKSYQEFLCRDLRLDRIVPTLKLCTKFNLKIVQQKAFEVVKEHNEWFSNNEEFLNLVMSNQNLSKYFFAMLLRSIPKHYYVIDNPTPY